MKQISEFIAFLLLLDAHFKQKLHCHQINAVAVRCSKNCSTNSYWEASQQQLKQKITDPRQRALSFIKPMFIKTRIRKTCKGHSIRTIMIANMLNGGASVQDIQCVTGRNPEKSVKTLFEMYR